MNCPNCKQRLRSVNFSQRLFLPALQEPQHAAPTPLATCETCHQEIDLEIVREWANRSHRARVFTEDKDSVKGPF